MTYVFLSHARSDVDPYFETFYKDFTAELRGRMGLSAEDQLAFRDSEGIPLGVDWRAKIESELLECRTFLAMLSPTYMRRQACAREWAVFEWRQRNSAGVMQPDLLIPLAWIPTPPGDLSATIHKRQSAHASLGKMYARYGLRHVVRREGTEYQELLTALAEHVTDLARRPVVPVWTTEHVPELLPDPFAPVTEARPPVATPGGPKHVEFIVVAARQSELASERQFVSSYGSDVHDWCPYLPMIETRVGLLVQQVALEQQLTAGFAEIAHNIVDRLQGARARNTLAVLLIDVWSLRLTSYRSFMNLFDRAERFANVGVLVLWNLADAETNQRRESLSETLRFALPNLMVIKDPPAFHEQIANPDELIEKLRNTLQVLRLRIMTLGEVMRKAEGATQIAKPILAISGAA